MRNRTPISSYDGQWPPSRARAATQCQLRAGMAAVAATLVTLLLTGDLAAPVASARAPGQDPPVVMTTEGPVSGVVEGATGVWLGIPYAAPPVAELRWRPPAPPPPRTGEFDATRRGPACPQIRQLTEAPPSPFPQAIVDATGPPSPAGLPSDRGTAATQGSPLQGASEDCLTLNIWAPRSAHGPLPVMVWLHGGGFIQGSGGDTIYDGARLAAQGVIVVTINYRLGALGFLAHEGFIEGQPPAAGNYGLRDQLRALVWLQANIAGFGGDPGRVTIFGQSAGGVSVCALMAAPAGEGLFHRAIMQSGNCLPALPHVSERRGVLPPAVDQGRRFSEAIGCADAADEMACLRGKPVSEILDTLPGTIGVLTVGETYGPVIDDDILTADLEAAIKDGTAAAVPFALGATADEGTIFVTAFAALTPELYEALVATVFPTYAQRILALYPADSYSAPNMALADVTGDVGFVCPARRAARGHAAAGRPAFLYHFTHVTEVGRVTGLGSHHGAEIPFVFGSPLIIGPARTLSDAMQAAWTAFAAAGEPGRVGPVDWAAYDPVADGAVEFAQPVRVTAGWRRERCDLWDEVASEGTLPGLPTPTPRSWAVYLPQAER